MSDNSYSNGEFLGLAGRASARFHGVPTPGATQRVDYTATAASNTVDLPVDANVMVTATTACFIRLSADGLDAAVADVDMYLVPNLPYMVRLSSFSGVPNRRVSAVHATADGTLYIVPMLAE
jgi:hypothetical protein